MTSINDIHTAIDLMGKKPKQESKKFEDYIVNFDFNSSSDLPLDKCFAITDAGDVHRLSEKICPLMKGRCQLERCQAYHNGICSLFETSTQHPVMKTEDAVDGAPESASQCVSPLIYTKKGGKK